MKTPVKWLKEYVPITLSPAETANRLTMAGIEVKEVKTIGGNWDNVYIGQVLEIKPHPNADRLRLVTVDLGFEQQTVVCGAPNLTLGDKIVFAKVGAQLIDGHTGKPATLSPAKIRGVVSAGMVCSEKELGISDNHEGIMVLPMDAKVGMPLAEYLGDSIIDLEVTPNRPDCLSIIGIAREIAALTSQTLHVADPAYEEGTSSIQEQVAVQIVERRLCPRYCASLITGVKIAPSPKWMQDRLAACGMRPINNIVDITNYVMLEYGQPLHSFDYERIKGKKIIVRRAAQNEVIISLDGVERPLSPDMLVIADESRAVAVAGVMGGANSEVTDGTTSILLEAANFNAASIHYTSRKLLLTSEASMRFERGIRPGLTIPALKRATQLIILLGGGAALKGIVDVYPGKMEPKAIKLSPEDSRRILGVGFKTEQMQATLESLGFECKAEAAGLSVTAPYWRSDISQTVDLVEEVARIVGYDKVPLTMLSQPIPRQNPDPMFGLRNKIITCLTGYGFEEMITYSLTSLDRLNKLMPEPHPLDPAPARLANPMTADQEYLRPNLRANLLGALAENRRHEEGGLRLFELGRIYLPRPKDLPAEPEMLCGILSGARTEKSWADGGEPFDFFDAKGAVEALSGRLGIEVTFESSADEGLHPNRQAAIVIGGSKMGVVGEAHPRVVDAYEVAGPVFLFELNVTALLPFTTGRKMYKPVPRFPTVVRDMALVVATGTTHRSIVELISGFPLVSNVSLFDVYSGEQVGAGKKSLAYHISYQSPDHTLTDEEVIKVHQQILDKLSKELGATLRA